MEFLLSLLWGFIKLVFWGTVLYYVVEYLLRFIFLISLKISSSQKQQANKTVIKKNEGHIICDIRKLIKDKGASLPPDIPYLIEEKHYQDPDSDRYIITERKYHFRTWFGRLSNTSCIKKFKRHKAVGLIHRDKYLENVQDFIEKLKSSQN